MAKYCTSCGSIIREGSRFCQKCGTPFSEACPQCGAQVSGTKFCPECGYKLEPLIPVEESSGGVYEEVPANNSSIKLEEPVYRTPGQTENDPYTTKNASSPFDVGSTSASSAFDNGASKNPFYKKWWFWLIAGLVLLGIIGAIASSSDKADISSNHKEETSSEPVSSKKEKNGFDKETNNDYEVGGIRYSVPDYFGDGTTEDDMIQLYAETGEKVVMLQIASLQDASVSLGDVYSGLDRTFDDFLEAMELYETGQERSEKTKLAGLPAKHYSVHGKSSQLNDEPLIIDATFGYDDETQMLHSVLLMQTGDTEYSYNKDYEKIVESADKTDAHESADTDDNSSGAASSSVKEALDSYEAFVDEYVAFMKKYENSSDTSGMLTDYVNYMSRYADLTEKMESMEEEDMSDADYAYYTEVMLRCSQKMLQVAG